MTFNPHGTFSSILVAHHEDTLRGTLRKTLREAGG